MKKIITSTIFMIYISNVFAQTILIDSVARSSFASEQSKHPFSKKFEIGTLDFMFEGTAQDTEIHFVLYLTNNQGIKEVIVEAIPPKEDKFDRATMSGWNPFWEVSLVNPDVVCCLGKYGDIWVYSKVNGVWLQSDIVSLVGAVPSDRITSMTQHMNLIDPNAKPRPIRKVYFQPLNTVNIEIDGKITTQYIISETGEITKK
jgi:hypothetical protein